MPPEPRNETAPAIARAEADLAETHERVAVSITALQREIARTLDWRHWIRRRPRMALGIAFGVGLWLGRRR